MSTPVFWNDTAARSNRSRSIDFCAHSCLRSRSIASFCSFSASSLSCRPQTCSIARSPPAIQHSKCFPCEISYVFPSHASLTRGREGEREDGGQPGHVVSCREESCGCTPATGEGMGRCMQRRLSHNIMLKRHKLARRRRAICMARRSWQLQAAAAGAVSIAGPRGAGFAAAEHREALA